MILQTQLFSKQMKKTKEPKEIKELLTIKKLAFVPLFPSNKVTPKKQKINYYYGKQVLLQEIKETKASIELAQSNFQYMTDPNLVDCAIYELKAAQKRYAYLLECAKKYDMTCLYDQVIS